MAKAKISELPALGESPGENDIAAIVDVSTGITKKTTIAEIMGNRSVISLASDGCIVWPNKWRINLDGTSLVFSYWDVGSGTWCEHSRLDIPL
ncbi:MAG: hypothetical protein AB1847_17505 [bacterium]